MSNTAVARRYAKAFIELAIEVERVDSLGAELKKADAIFSANDLQIYSVLKNPVFTTEEQRSVLLMLLPKMGLSQLSNNLLNLLLDRRRFNCLPDILAIYGEYADEKAGRTRVQVQTAEPMSPELLAEITASFEKATGKTILISSEVKPELIGGMTARIGSLLYDASVKNRLAVVKQLLLSAQPPAAS